MRFENKFNQALWNANVGKQKMVHRANAEKSARGTNRIDLIPTHSAHKHTIAYMSIHHLPTNWSKIDVSISLRRRSINSISTSTTEFITPLIFPILHITFEIRHVLWLFSHFQHEMSTVKQFELHCVHIFSHCFKFAWLHWCVSWARISLGSNRIIIKLICIARYYTVPWCICDLLAISHLIYYVWCNSTSNAFLIGNKTLMDIFMQSAKWSSLQTRSHYTAPNGI